MDGLFRHPSRLFDLYEKRAVRVRARVEQRRGVAAREISSRKVANQAILDLVEFVQRVDEIVDIGDGVRAVKPTRGARPVRETNREFRHPLCPLLGLFAQARRLGDATTLDGAYALSLGLRTGRVCSHAALNSSKSRKSSPANRANSSATSSCDALAQSPTVMDFLRDIRDPKPMAFEGEAA